MFLKNIRIFDTLVLEQQSNTLIDTIRSFRRGSFKKVMKTSFYKSVQFHIKYDGTLELKIEHDIQFNML